METTGSPALSRLDLRVLRPVWMFFMPFSSRWILSLTRRRLISSFVSPGPLPPIPPVSRDMAVFFSMSRGSRYWSWASSTWILPSRLWARWAKMSRMSWGRLMIFSSVKSVIERICAGVSS